MHIKICCFLWFPKKNVMTFDETYDNLSRVTDKRVKWPSLARTHQTCAFHFWFQLLCYCFFVLLLLFSVTNNFTVILSTLQRMIEFTVTTRNIAAFFNSSLVRMLSRRRTCDNDFWHVVGANTLLAPFLSTSIFVKRISYGFQFFLDDSILTTRWQHTWQLTIYFLSFYFWLYQFM